MPQFSGIKEVEVSIQSDQHDQKAPNEWETQFWKGIEEKRLVLPICAVCGTSPGLPTVTCPSCGSFDFNWHDHEWEGMIYSWTTLHRQRHPNFPTPLTVAVISLSDAPAVHLVCRIVSTETSFPEIGARGRVQASNVLESERLLPSPLTFEVTGSQGEAR